VESNGYDIMLYRIYLGDWGKSPSQESDRKQNLSHTLTFSGLPLMAARGFASLSSRQAVSCFRVNPPFDLVNRSDPATSRSSG
jgi:hypothetical protein